MDLPWEQGIGTNSVSSQWTFSTPVSTTKCIAGQVLTTIYGFKRSRKFGRCLSEVAIVVYIWLKGLDLVSCFTILIFCGA